MQERQRDDARPDEEEDELAPDGMRRGGGGKAIPADDPLDRSMEGEDADTIAQHATPPTEGPAAAGALPG